MQERLVAAHHDCTQEAVDCEREATETEQAIERYIMETLGIEITQAEQKKGLQFVRFKDVERWSLDAILGNKDTTYKCSYPTEVLGKLCKAKSGATPSKGNPAYWNGSIPWISPKDMKTDKIKNSQDFVSQKAIEDNTLSLLTEKSILIVVRSGILQRLVPVAINLVPVTINQDLRAFTLNDSRLTVEFLFYFLEQAQTILLRLVKNSTTVQSIDSDKLEDLSIPLPPLDVQAEIVETVSRMKSRIKELRDKAARLRREAKEAFEKELFL